MSLRPCQRAQPISLKRFPLTAGSGSRGGNLFAAPEALGVQRYIQQSSGFYLAARDGLADESAPMRIDAPGGVVAEDAVEQAGAEGVYSQTRFTGATNRKAKASLAFDPRPLVWKDN